MYHIYGYVIDGVPIGELQWYASSGLEGHDPYIISRKPTPPPGYVDVTTMKRWAGMWGVNGMDYKFIRSRIKGIVSASGWQNLSDEDKRTAAEWFVVTPARRDEVMTMEEQVQYGIDFHTNSIEAREARYKAAASEIYNRLSRQEQMIVAAEIEGRFLGKMYVQYGIEGILRGDAEGLFDYIEGTPGTSWAGSGLKQDSRIRPRGIRRGEMIDNVMAIFVSGLHDFNRNRRLGRGAPKVSGFITRDGNDPRELVHSDLMREDPGDKGGISGVGRL